MEIVPLTSATWKPAVMSTWKMKNCSIDDTKKDTTFTVSPMLNGCMLKNHPKEIPTDWITRLNKIKGIFK